MLDPWVTAQFLGIIGANGAGKTTLLNLVTGYLTPTSGSITFEGKPIQGLPPYRIARLGIGRTFQITQPFAEMSVLENVMAGALFSEYGRHRTIAQAREDSIEPLELVGLHGQALMPAGSLTLGAKKKLELARALATRPRLLLLDEVMGGLTHEEVEDLMVVLRRIHQSGMTIVMIEHLVHVIVEHGTGAGLARRGHRAPGSYRSLPWRADRVRRRLKTLNGAPS